MTARVRVRVRVRVSAVHDCEPRRHHPARGVRLDEVALSIGEEARQDEDERPEVRRAGQGEEVGRPTRREEVGRRDAVWGVSKPVAMEDLRGGGRSDAVVISTIFVSECSPTRKLLGNFTEGPILATILVSECSPSSATLGIGTLNLCPIRTPGHRNWPPTGPSSEDSPEALPCSPSRSSWPPVYSHRAAPGPSWPKSAPERTGPPLVVKRRHGFGWKSYADVDTIWSTYRQDTPACGRPPAPLHIAAAKDLTKLALGELRLQRLDQQLEQIAAAALHTRPQHPRLLRPRRERGLA